MSVDHSAFQNTVWQHFAAHARALPWRHAKGGSRDPYLVWLAEIMLQQTTVATVQGYYQRFLQHFPTLELLANADLQEVLNLWQGLGYYQRARNLHKCAQAIVQVHAGQWPQTAADLQQLPGIGPYTAAAVAALAFDEPTVVVDGNIERIMSRIFAVVDPLPTSKPQLRKLAAELAPNSKPGDYAEGLMDIGATICTPKNPQCNMCPLQPFCAAHQQGIAAELPKRQRKAAKPHKHGTAYVLLNEGGELYLRQRPDKGLLAELWEVPHSGWEEGVLPATHSVIKWSDKGEITHVFTHFKLTLQVKISQTSDQCSSHNWFNVEKLPPLSTLMRKVLKQANVLS